jgi:two-component system LytT family response regulator
MTVRAMIVEDEPLARHKLRGLIDDVPWLHFVGEAADGIAAVDLFDTLRPDVVFLDIHLPGQSGLEALARARHRPAVIFTTAFDQYAVTAFELAAVDYLLKPFSRQRFLAAIERARPRVTAGPTADTADVPAARVHTTLSPARPLRRVFARDGNGIVPIRALDIIRIDANDDSVVVHTRDRRLSLNVSLSDIERRLDPTTFVRVHRSHLVNLDHVADIVPYDAARLLLRFRDGVELVASRQGSRLLRATGR